MNSYQVYKHEKKETKVVKKGFAWLAIPFNLAWFISRRLWKVFFSYVLIILFLAGVDYEIYGELGFINFPTASDPYRLLLIIQIIIFTLPGFKGNEWTVDNLQKKGYKLTYSVKASSKKVALELAHKEK